MTDALNDEMLVAYLDGELDEATRGRVKAAITSQPMLAERAALLKQGSLPYAESFAPLLGAAPLARLETMLEGIALPAKAMNPASRLGRRSLIAAAIGCLFAGVALDRALLAVQHISEDEAFRAEVAEYLALYTPETLRNMTISRDKRQAQLQYAGERLGLRLDPFVMHLGALEMRRTQVLEYDGKPLGQIMYLDPDHGPVALCIIAGSSGSTQMKRETRSGLNLIYWSSDTHGFVMAAHNPMDELKARADEIRSDLADRNQV